MSITKNLKGYLLKLFTKKDKIDFNIKDAKSVLFLRYDRIGDMIITTPVFRELKKLRPDIKIGVLASSSNIDIIKHNPYIDDIYINEKDNILKDYQVLKKIQNKYDVVVEFDHSVVPHAIARIKLINPKIVISTYKDGRYGVSGKELQLYDYYTSNNLDRHFRDIWLECISFFGTKEIDNRYDLHIPQNDIAKNFVANFGDKIKIGINLEGSIKNKEITKDNLRQILLKLKEKIDNIQVIILFAPNKKSYVKDMISEFGFDFVVPSFDTRSILDVASLIKELDFVLTPDTSIVHIASSYDIPIVSIHENNLHSYRLFAPVSSLSDTVFAKSSSGLFGYSIEEIIEKSSNIIDKIRDKK